MRHFNFWIWSPYYPNIVNNPINLDCCDKINKSKSTSSQLPGSTFNQSIHQSTNKSINQWIHHSLVQSIHQSPNKSFNKWIHHSLVHSMDQSIGQSIDKINRSINRSTNKSIDKSNDQWIDQSQPFQNKNVKLYRKLAKKEKYWKNIRFFF